MSKMTRRFRHSKGILDRYFLFIWTVPIADDGTKGQRKKRLVRKDQFRWPQMWQKMSDANIALRIKPDGH